MTHLTKTDAIVLRKLNYGDSSKIVTLYTEEHGKESAMIKGGRSSKSKIGSIVDVMNNIQVVFYKKDNREVQLISQADLISHYPKTKDDLEKLKYASGVLELLQSLTAMNEKNSRLYKGTVKILTLFNDSDDDPKILFLRYFLFFIDEIGYSLIREECSECGCNLTETSKVFYNYEKGFLCENCGKENLVNYEFSKELFNLLICLNKKKTEFEYTEDDIKRIIMFLEKFLSYHIHEFKGIKSLHLF